MAFPQIVQQQLTVLDYDSDTIKPSFTLQVPAGITSGNSLIALVAGASDLEITTPSGWTRIGTNINSEQAGFWVFVKLAGETETSPTVSVPDGFARGIIANVYEVSGTVPENIEFAVQEEVGTTSPATPSLTLSSGADDNLWFAGFVNNEFLPTDNLTGYTQDVSTGLPTSSGFIYAQYEHRQEAVATESPGTYSLPSSDSSITFTLGIAPGAAPPSVTLDNATLTPGSTVSGTATNFSTDPTSVTVSDGTNSISSASEITDFSYSSVDDSWSFTMPSDPGLTEGSVTVDLGEASATATYDDPMVPGLPAYSLFKNGVSLGDLTGIECRVVTGADANGTQIYYAGNLTATAGVLDSEIDLSGTSANVGDTVTVSILTTGNEGIVFTTTVGDNAA